MENIESSPPPPPPSIKDGKMARFGHCAASSLISEERGVCCSYFILSTVVDRVIFKTWRQFLCHWARRAWSYFSHFPCGVPRSDQLKTWTGSHKASKFMALLSIDLKQLGCCSRPILKSPLTVRTFYTQAPGRGYRITWTLSLTT